MDADISDGELQREVIELYGERYPDMSLNDWRHIIEDYTPMVREATKTKAKEISMQPEKLGMAADNPTKTVTLYPEFHEGCVPLFTLRAACGYFDDGEVPEEEGWVDASGNGFTPDPKRHFAVHAKGDSMLPKIKDGDICVFEWYRAGSRNGEIVLTECSEKDIDYGGMYTIKKYQSEKLITDEGWQHTKVELIPLNKDYDVIELSTDNEYKTIGVLKCVL
jgi:SOS-response transcriptional repressor LexA